MLVDPGCGSARDGTEDFVLSMSDNDFVTQNGFVNGGMMPYRDASGVNLQSQAVVFRVAVPEGRAAGCGGELSGAGQGRERGGEGFPIVWKLAAW